MTSSYNEQQDFTPTGSIQWDSSWPESAKEERHELLFYLEKRFGIDNYVFDDYLLFKKNKNWWFLKKSDFINDASSLKVWMTGLRAFQRVGKYIKPTTRMIQLFGHHAVRALLDIQENDIKILADGGALYHDKKMDNGYIILSYNGAVLGLGLLIDGRITSQIPRRDMISLVG